MPPATRRFSACSGEVRSQRSREPANVVEKLSMFGSVVPPSLRIGVSTSITPRSAKNVRTSAYSLVRSLNARRADFASRMMLLQERDELRLVPDLDAELLRLFELRSGRFAGDDERGLLRNAARDFRAERFEPRRCLIARQRRERAGQYDALAVKRPGLRLARRLRRQLQLLDRLRATLHEHAALVRGEIRDDRFGSF